MKLGVNVAVIDGDRILLMKREDFEVWCLPGGEVDQGESLASAAVREVAEETGLEVALQGVIGTYSRPNWHGGIHIVLFLGTRTDGELVPDPVEAVDIGWFARTELPTPLMLGQRRRIEDAFADRRGIARSNPIRSPFVDRADAYRRRDESPLGRAEFYKTFSLELHDDDALEVPVDL